MGRRFRALSREGPGQIQAGAGVLTFGPSAAAPKIRRDNFNYGSKDAMRSLESTDSRNGPSRLARKTFAKPVGDRTSQRRPITVAGPWPIFTAFPFPRPNQFSFAVYAARRAVSTARRA
jgi:hypothetical protein